MSLDMKARMKDNMKKERDILQSDTNITIKNKDQNIEGVKTLKIGKKDKTEEKRKAFPLYMDSDLKKKLDSISKTTSYSKNELITMMIEFALANLELTK